MTGVKIEILLIEMHKFSFAFPSTGCSTDATSWISTDSSSLVHLKLKEYFVIHSAF